MSSSSLALAIVSARLGREPLSGYRAKNACWFCRRRIVRQLIPDRQLDFAHLLTSIVLLSAFMSALDFFRISLSREGDSPSLAPGRPLNGRSSIGDRKALACVEPTIFSGDGFGLELDAEEVIGT